MSKAFPCVDVIVHQMRRHLGAFLAVLALSVQSLIPTGYMVGARGETDGFAITLCTSNGMVNAVMNDNGQITELGAGNKARSDVPQPDDDHTKSVCGFAAQSIALFGPTSFEPHNPRTRPRSAATAKDRTATPSLKPDFLLQALVRLLVSLCLDHSL
jgi:hypothetical protein